MKKQSKKFLAMLLTGVVAISGMSISSFAAAGTDSVKGENRNIGQVALYQDGALSDAYIEGEGSEKYTAPAAGTYEGDLYKGLKNFDEKIHLGDYKMPVAEAQEGFTKLINSNPDLFYVSNIVDYYYYIYCEDCNGWIWYVSDANAWYRLNEINDMWYPCEHNADSHHCYEAVYDWAPHYIAGKSQLTTMTSNFNKAVEKAMAGIDESMTDLEKALYCHDYIEKINSYDYESYTAGSVPASSHSAYGPLVLNTSVCDGYALAYSYLMQQCGINTRLVTSDDMAHAWSAVELDGEWYFVDLTYDDPIYSFSNADKGNPFDVVYHDAFLMSETLLKNTQYDSGNYRGWAQTDIVADNTQYDTAIWKLITDAEGSLTQLGVSNEYGYCDGYWYYLDDASLEIMKTDDPTQAGTVYSSLVKNSAGTWPVVDKPGYAYNTSYGKASVYAAAKVLFVSTADKIYMIDLTTDETKFVDFSTSDGYLYGLTVIGDTLYVGIANAPTEKETIEKIYLGEIKTGDTNADGSITAEDALGVLKYVVGIADSSFYIDVADTNGDGGITAEDALQILKYVVGIVTEL